MNTGVNLVSSETIELSMEYGHFCISGGLGLDTDYADLFERARAARPFASNGLVMAVLSPHGDNFRMPMTVQVWSARPVNDRNEWQQVCEAHLRVGSNAALILWSATLGTKECTVPEGEYLIEVGGRGFVSYDWPGSYEPGDVWRIRLWPDDGSEPLPAVQWSMPGYGVPENIPIPKRPASTEPEGPRWVGLLGEDGVHRHIPASELEESQSIIDAGKPGAGTEFGLPPR